VTRIVLAGNKYGARKTEYNGRLYDSKKEAAYAQGLDVLEKAGVVAVWIPQFKIDIEVNGAHICNILVDFFIIYVNGEHELVEIKSKATKTPVWRLKVKLLQATYLKTHPGVNYTVVD
jgi:hypothetical protein